MPNITFIDHTGKEYRLQAEAGKNLMQIATENMVPSILGDCGGACSCATCHGYIDPAWLDKVEAKTEAEEMMLDGALNVEANSRLTCQITLTDAIDGIVVRLPASQI